VLLEDFQSLEECGMATLCGIPSIHLLPEFEAVAPVLVVVGYLVPCLLLSEVEQLVVLVVQMNERMRVKLP